MDNDIKYVFVISVRISYNTTVFFYGKKGHL